MQPRQRRMQQENNERAPQQPAAPAIENHEQEENEIGYIRLILRIVVTLSFFYGFYTQLQQSNTAHTNDSNQSDQSQQMNNNPVAAAMAFALGVLFAVFPRQVNLIQRLFIQLFEENIIAAYRARMHGMQEIINNHQDDIAQLFQQFRHPNQAISLMMGQVSNYVRALLQAYYFLYPATVGFFGGIGGMTSLIVTMLIGDALEYAQLHTSPIVALRNTFLAETRDRRNNQQLLDEAGFPMDLIPWAYQYIDVQIKAKTMSVPVGVGNRIVDESHFYDCIILNPIFSNINQNLILNENQFPVHFSFNSIAFGRVEWPNGIIPQPELHAEINLYVDTVIRLTNERRALINNANNGNGRSIFAAIFAADLTNNDYRNIADQANQAVIDWRQQRENRLG